MISRTLAPVDRTPDINIMEVAEALALTYLASYNNEPVQPRVREAYMRAWGLDSFKMFPRDGLTPGFVVAFATLPHRKTMTVAIEGTTNAGQIAATVNNYLFGGISGLMQAVNYYKNFADAVKVKLLADNECAAAINNPLTMFTLTGHSLGAAIADILLYRFKEAYPNKSARVIKFGSPRVGNERYVNRSVLNGPRKNVYCNLDPIHQFPSATIGSMGLLNVVGTLTGAVPSSENPCMCINRVGETFSAGTSENNQSCGHFLDAAAINSAGPITNIWWDHWIKTYRLAMMNLAGRNDDLLKYRFNFLEHNDEDTWQSRWSPGLLTWENLTALSPTTPTPVEPISAGVATSPALTSGGGDWEYDADAGGGGGDWGNPADIAQETPVSQPPTRMVLPSRLITSQRPRRAFVAPPPS